MLCKLLAKPFDGKDFIFEQKIDGIRIIAVKDSDRVWLWTRNRLDRSKQFPEITEAVKNLSAQQLILDGEVAVAHKTASSFQAIQPRVQQTSPQAIAKLARSVPVVYFAFDLLHLNGKDCKKLPLIQRKDILRRIVGGKIKFLPFISRTGKSLFAKAKKLGWEGIVGKRKNSKYIPGKRGKDWVKIKTHLNQELVIVGYTKGQGKVAGTFGALLVGYYQRDKLKFAGEAGTGYTDAERRQLKILMDKHKATRSPFFSTPQVKNTTWLKPILVGQFKFAEWTKDNLLRAPVYLGLRNDKSAHDVKKE